MVVTTAPLEATKGAPSAMPKARARRRLITGEELLAMGDIGPCELIDGRIVRVNPSGNVHAYLESSLVFALTSFVRQHRLGRVLVGEVGVYTRRGPDRVRGADIAFVSTERLASVASKGYLTVAPDLIVEIISPTDRWQDVRQKLEEYFDIGVHRVWIVEPDKRTVLVYASSTEVRAYREGDTLIGEGVLEGFALPVSDLFEE
jgi:Uma2 family endonuclease